MNRQNPYTHRAIDRNKRAIIASGLHVTGILENGTVLCSEVPPSLRPELPHEDPPSRPRMRVRPVRIGTVYFISDGEFIKIGFANNWVIRRRDLQIANARKLIPLLVIEGGLRMEAHLHSLFGEHCVRGEWFRPAPEIMAYIDERKADSLLIEAEPT